MRIFVTGATGFIGSAIVKELVQAGHNVLGLSRSEASAELLTAMGAQVHKGDLDDIETLQSGAKMCDAVIHTAFNHDFSRYKENCEADRRVVTAIGEVLKGTEHPFIITSGIGLISLDRVITEHDVPPSSEVMPRAATEEAGDAVRELGVNVYSLRLPPSVHGVGDHGFVPMLIDLARKTGVSAYIGEGDNRWPAVHRLDAALVYRQVVERLPQHKIIHAVGEEGIPFRKIAEAIGSNVGLPVVGLEGEAAETHFGWFKHFAAINCAASSQLTGMSLNWEPRQATLLADLNSGHYF